MIPLKLWFAEKDVEFMKDYKSATGIPVKHFVATAVAEYIAKVQAEQAMRDAPFNPVSPEVLANEIAKLNSFDNS